jgi:hypothetical protein
MAALLTEDATLQNEWGDVVQGRTNIEATLTRLMATSPPAQNSRTRRLFPTRSPRT